MIYMHKRDYKLGCNIKNINYEKQNLLHGVIIH